MAFDPESLPALKAIFKVPFDAVGIGHDGGDVTLKKEMFDLPGLVLVFDLKV